jgi:hypothetical protein
MLELHRYWNNRAAELVSARSRHDQAILADPEPGLAKQYSTVLRAAVTMAHIIQI